MCIMFPAFPDHYRVLICLLAEIDYSIFFWAELIKIIVQMVLSCYHISFQVLKYDIHSIIYNYFQKWWYQSVCQF